MYRRDKMIDIVCGMMDKRIECDDLMFLNRRVGLGYDNTETKEFTDVKKKIFKKRKEVQQNESSGSEEMIKRYKNN